MEEERIQLYKKAARSIVGNEPQEENCHQHSISFAFSLQILSSEGLAVKGDATLQKSTTGVPQRASRPDNTNDLYDDQQLGIMPRSAIRWKPTSPTQAGQDIYPHAHNGTTTSLTSHHWQQKSRVMSAACPVYRVPGRWDGPSCVGEL